MFSSLESDFHTLYVSNASRILSMHRENDTESLEEKFSSLKMYYYYLNLENNH
jgi:hypothetical protein